MCEKSLPPDHSVNQGVASRTQVKAYLLELWSFWKVLERFDHFGVNKAIKNITTHVKSMSELGSPH